MRDVYLDHVSWSLGELASTVAESAAAGRVRSAGALFEDAGFRQHHRCAPATRAYDLALRATRPLGDALDGVDALVYATTLPCNANLGDAAAFARSGDVKHLADFPASHLQAELGLERAAVVGLTQQACTGILGAVRVARGLLASEPHLSRALCVTADRFPGGARYEQAYNLVSDGAVACVVSAAPRGYRVLACHAVTNGALARAGDDEAVGSYFTYTHRAVLDCLALEALAPGDVDWFVPQNMNPKAWRILASVLGVPFERVAMPTLAHAGHLIGGDNLVNLAAHAEAGAVRPGELLLLVCAGFGLSWQTLLLEKV
jgi:3-oxoacyl-[acyl-carrier-protein] synthase-3